jgi:hypothetical protein
MNSHTCLNCGEPITQNFCGNCGQRASTHRFSIPHVLSHDILHGVFHLDRGFLFTTKEIMTRPGRSIREYIDGKRVNHYNYAAFLIWLVAINLLVTASSGFSYADLATHGAKGQLSFMQKLQAVQHDYAKELLLIQILMNTCCTYVFFRKARLNFAEHFVMNSYRAGGQLIILTLVFAILIPLKRYHLNPTLVYSSMGPIAFIYSIWFYIQFFEPDFNSVWSIIARAIAMVTVVGVFTGLCVAALLYYMGIFNEKSTLQKQMDKQATHQSF